MKIKLLVSRAGPGISQNAGDVVQIENEEAARMIAAGQAVAVSKKEKEFAFKKKVTENRA